MFQGPRVLKTGNQYILLPTCKGEDFALVLYFSIGNETEEEEGGKTTLCSIL